MAFADIIAACSRTTASTNQSDPGMDYSGRHLNKRTRISNKNSEMSNMLTLKLCLFYMRVFGAQCYVPVQKVKQTNQ